MPRWLHISDFHFKSKQSYDQDLVTGALIKSIGSIANRFGKPDFILATGDIANWGKREEYSTATIFFDSLLQELGLDKSCLYVIPGNHDVDRDKSRGLNRTLKDRAEADLYFEDTDDLIHIIKKQAAFIEWYDGYFSGLRSFPRNTTVFQMWRGVVNGQKVAITAINSALFCQDDNDNGNLWIGRRNLDQYLRSIRIEHDELSIAIMHHPHHWLNPEEADVVKTALRDSFDCIATGHLHENSVENSADAYSDTIFLSAGAAYQTSKWPNTALMCEFAEGNITIHPIRYGDKPRPTWSPDTTLFPTSNDYSGSFKVSRLQPVLPANNIAQSSGLSVLKADSEHDNGPKIDASSRVSILRKEFEKELFTNTKGVPIYAEFRLMNRRQEFVIDDDEAREVPIEDILNGEHSLLIESRTEYGGSTLLKKLHIDFQAVGHNCVLKDARNLPNYKRKLEKEFEEDEISRGKTVLLLDHYDLERDEKLFNELIGLNYFTRYVILTVNRELMFSKDTSIDRSDYKFNNVYLWTMHRNQLRKMAETFFDTGDNFTVSKIVDKVYIDLNGLSIPITPANAIMYMRILNKEDEYSPVSRVDIVGKYLQNILKRSSDLADGGASSKMRMDIVSELAYDLYVNEHTWFDHQYWYSFCRRFQTKSYIEFDETVLLSELIESRVFLQVGRTLYFKYSFFFTYFLGRSIASRFDRLQVFMEHQHYMKLHGVIDVITSLQPDNSIILLNLTEKLEQLVGEFREKYIEIGFDPLVTATWATSENEQEKVWNPVAAEIEKGPKNTNEIDIIKSSIVEEARSSNQNVLYNEFFELETALFFTESLVTSALKNSDALDGEKTARALSAIMEVHTIAFQIGTVFADLLATQTFVRWGGVSFLDFNKPSYNQTSSNSTVIIDVIINLLRAVCNRVASDVGTQRLTGVFRALAVRNETVVSTDMMIFAGILNAKGPSWHKHLEYIVDKTDRKSFYLAIMLRILIRELRVEILQSKDRDHIQRLIALIRTKRQLNRQNPGSRAVDKMYRILEKKGFQVS